MKKTIEHKKNTSNQWNRYSRLEIPGTSLIPGFSVYLLEIRYKGKKFFYIGMTGDPYFPSARSIFHRISGHLELNKNSKQNQLWTAIKNEIGIDEGQFENLNIIIHHFPIQGFKEWVGKKDHKSIKNARKSKEYLAYKQSQEDVLLFEKALISEFANCNLLNKKSGIGLSVSEKYISICNMIREIINV